MRTTDLQGEVNVRNFELSVGERSAEIAGLLIGGRPVSEVDFRSIPCERLEGSPLGWVNIPPDQGGDEPGLLLYVAWVNHDGHARRPLVPAQMAKQFEQLFVDP